jgi:hypothetical protein
MKWRGNAQYIVGGLRPVDAVYTLRGRVDRSAWDYTAHTQCEWPTRAAAQPLTATIT